MQCKVCLPHMSPITQFLSQEATSGIETSSSFSFFGLRWVFVAARRLSLVGASGGYSSLRCTGFSLQWLLFSCCGARALGARASVVVARGLHLLWRAGSVVVACSLSCSAACGIFLDQGSNTCPLHCRWILNHCATREVPRNILRLHNILF